MPITIAQLNGIPGLKEPLAEDLDFCLSDSAEDAVWFRVQGPESFEPIAKEGAGGVFLIGHKTGVVLYVTSEGSAGVIANSLAEFLQLSIAHPYWKDLLKFSGDGKLSEIKRAAQFLEQDLLDEFPDIEEKKAALYERLDLLPGKDPISALHHAVNTLGSSIKVLAPDDWECGSLFNTFMLRTVGN